RKTPASYLLQWEAIKDAKKEGLSTYNFWGIAKDDDPRGAWHGLSQFKKGFGGQRLDFVHSQDLPLTKKYWLSYLIDYVTKIKKGYN
ncbi:peptidoglycan bridge formation glycyltransferase FemA/FemB family protein, partial [Candidatus Parcubacteria bacterium]